MDLDQSNAPAPQLKERVGGKLRVVPIVKEQLRRGAHMHTCMAMDGLGLSNNVGSSKG